MYLCAERKNSTPDDCLFYSGTPKRSGLAQIKLNFPLIITKGKKKGGRGERERFAFNELENTVKSALQAIIQLRIISLIKDYKQYFLTHISLS